MNTLKAIKRLRTIVIIACIISGSLAGGNIYRYVIEVPAWRHLDMKTWAMYSRHADLGNGVFFFSTEAIGASILLITASIIVLSNKSALGTVAFPVHFATFFALAGLVLTFFAAPIMLSLRGNIDKSGEILRAFERFHFWGLLRAMAQVLSFLGSVWATGKAFEVYKPVRIV